MSLILWSRLVFIFLSVFVSLKAQAGGEGSGGTIFKRMTAQQAFESPLFDKVIEKITFHKSSTTYNPAYELCQEAQFVRTVLPEGVCTQWKMDSHKIFNNAEDLESYRQAKKNAEKQGPGFPYCEDQDVIPTVFAALADKMKLQYRVDYYLKAKEKSMSNYVGSHVYEIAACSNELINTSGIDWIIWDE